jgi:hypothetical protein
LFRRNFQQWEIYMLKMDMDLFLFIQ